MCSFWSGYALWLKATQKKLGDPHGKNPGGVPNSETDDKRCHAPAFHGVLHQMLPQEVVHPGLRSGRDFWKPCHFVWTPFLLGFDCNFFKHKSWDSAPQLRDPHITKPTPGILFRRSQSPQILRGTRQRPCVLVVRLCKDTPL